MGWTRRSLIVRGGMASGALALRGASAIATSPNAHKAKIIITGGHPGDPEYGCGGTIAAFAEQGHEVVLLYLNDGAWPPTSAVTRLAEAKKACELEFDRVSADNKDEQGNACSSRRQGSD